MTDLTVVVTAHSETLVAGPTMRSAEIAVEAARLHGFTVEQVIALDKATEATAEYFNQPRFDHWKRLSMHVGDSGLVRTAVVPMTEGDYIAFLDADDLFSENWLAEGMKAVKAGEARGEQIIASPELEVLFDRNLATTRNVGQDSPLFTPYFLYLRGYYDLLCISPRAAHLEVPYASRDIPNGLAREDFQYAVETMARGYKHITVKDTIIFKRRRDTSQAVESNARRVVIRSLPEMAIDRIRHLAGGH